MMPDPREHKVSCSDYRCEIEITLEIIGGKWESLDSMESSYSSNHSI